MAPKDEFVSVCVKCVCIMSVDLQNELGVDGRIGLKQTCHKMSVEMFTIISIDNCVPSLPEHSNIVSGS